MPVNRTTSTARMRIAMKGDPRCAEGAVRGGEDLRVRGRGWSGRGIHYFCASIHAHNEPVGSGSTRVIATWEASSVEGLCPALRRRRETSLPGLRETTWPLAWS